MEREDKDESGTAVSRLKRHNEDKHPEKTLKVQRQSLENEFSNLRQSFVQNATETNLLLKEFEEKQSISFANLAKTTLEINMKVVSGKLDYYPYLQYLANNFKNYSAISLALNNSVKALLKEIKNEGTRAESRDANSQLVPKKNDDLNAEVKKLFYTYQDKLEASAESIRSEIRETKEMVFGVGCDSGEYNDEIQNKVAKLFNAHTRAMEETIDDVKKMIRRAEGKIENTVPDISNKIERDLGEHARKMEEMCDDVNLKVDEMWEDVNLKVDEMWEDVNLKNEEMCEDVNLKIGKVKDELDLKVGKAKEEVIKTMKDTDQFKGEIREEFKKLLDAHTNKFEDITDEIKLKIRETTTEVTKTKSNVHGLQNLIQDVEMSINHEAYKLGEIIDDVKLLILDTTNQVVDHKNDVQDLKNDVAGVGDEVCNVKIELCEIKNDIAIMKEGISRLMFQTPKPN